MGVKPLFIVFEGLDGSGTSTQAKLLADHLSEQSSGKAKLTSEPSNGPIGQMIRSALSGRLHFTSGPTKFDHQLAFLFAADRHDHLHNDLDGVQKSLAEGFHVVCTRYYFSSYAYHCDDPSSFELVEHLNRTFPEPDVTIYIDVPINVSLHRLESRAHLDKYENAQKLARVKHNYDVLFSRYRGRLLKVSGDADVAAIHERIAELIDPLLRSI